MKKAEEEKIIKTKRFVRIVHDCVHPYELGRVSLKDLKKLERKLARGERVYHRHTLWNDGEMFNLAHSLEYKVGGGLYLQGVKLSDVRSIYLDRCYEVERVCQSVFAD